MRKRYERQRLAAGMMAFGLFGPAVAAELQPLGPPANASAMEPRSTLPSPAADGRAESTATMRGHPITGREVHNRQGEVLGSVDAILVDEHGRVTDVILTTGGVLGLGANLYRIPWERVDSTAVGGPLVVDIPKVQVSAEFSAFEPEVGDSHR